MKDEKQLGPFTIEELKENNLNSETYIWATNMSEWQKIKDVPIILEQLGITITPPPPPNTSQTEVVGYIKVVTEKPKIKVKYLLNPTRKEWFVIVAWCSFHALALFLSGSYSFNRHSNSEFYPFAHNGFYPFVTPYENCRKAYEINFLTDASEIAAKKESIATRMRKKFTGARVYFDTIRKVETNEQGKSIKITKLMLFSDKITSRGYYTRGYEYVDELLRKTSEYIIINDTVPNREDAETFIISKEIENGLDCDFYLLNYYDSFEFVIYISIFFIVFALYKIAVR